MTANDTIAAGYRMAKALIHRMVDDLTPMEFLHQPCPGANSTAWIVGHLALTLRKTAIRLGVDDYDLTGVSPGVTQLLSKTGQPAGDQSDILIGKDLLNLFDECIGAVIAAVKKLPSRKLAGPPSAPSPIANNYAEGLIFGSLHIAMHSGQLSTIRRSLGKPPVV
jgi:hypothetical protein